MKNLPSGGALTIEARKYYERYLSTGKSILLIGVGFDEKERNLSSYLEKKL